MKRFTGAACLLALTASLCIGADQIVSKHAQRVCMPETLVTLKPASLKDVVRLAGVSHSTVSRALRNSRRVNSETIDRIRRIAAESGYRSSAVGRSLATRRDFFATVRSGGVPRVTGQDGWRSLAVAVAAVASFRERRSVAIETAMRARA